MRGVTEPHRDIALDVERQAFLGAAGEEMHVAADRPQEVLAAPEQLVFVAVEHAAADQFLRLVHAVDVFGDPEQRMQIAQAAFAVFDIGFDQIARLTGTAVALFALGKLGGDEFRRAALHDLLAEPRRQLAEQLCVAEQIARLQKRGANGHVGFGLTNAFVDRAGSMADLEPHIPQAIEQRLGDLFAPGGRLVGQQKEEIDIGAGGEQAAAVAAGRDHRHAFGLGRHPRRIELGAGEFEQDADDLVLHQAQSLGAAPPVAILQQQFFRMRPRLRQRRFEPLRHGGAQFALTPGMGRRQGLKIGDDRCGIDQFDAAAVRSLGVEHRRIP